MKSMNDSRCIPKKSEDRAEGPLPYVQPLNLLDGKTKPSSWQRSVKRKFHSSACEPPPQSRKPESTLRTLRGLPPKRQLACVRKSLSDPLQVFGDVDGSDNQLSSLSGTTPSDPKDLLPKGAQRQLETTDMENLSRERRRGLKPGLKDTTNLDPKVTVKHNGLHLYNEVVALKEALWAEKEAHRCLQEELEEERNAASSAANEAMAMIARLQEEKAAVLMESRQFKRMAEERELHNQEAITLLKEMLWSKEEEVMALENELNACRQAFLAIEAGETAQNYDMKYLDMGGYGEGNLESELLSAHSSEALKSWASSFCDSKQFNACIDEHSRGILQEGAMNSEFYGGRYCRSFKELVSDNVRSNLESFFMKAGGPLEQSQNCSDGDFNKEDTTAESKRTMQTLKELAREIHGSEPVSKVSTAPLSFGKGCAEPTNRLTDEQTRNLWERIMKLENRLEAFAAEEQGFQFELTGNVGTAAGPQTPGFGMSTQQMNIGDGDEVSHDGHDDTLEAAGNGKLQCRGSGSPASSQQHIEDRVFGRVSGMDCIKSLEEQCEDARGEAVDTVLDIYEVGYESNQSAEIDCCRRSIEDNSSKHGVNAVESPDLLLELTAPDLEKMDVESHASMYSPSDSSDGRIPHPSLSEVEKEQLNRRLQALESEKHAMHEAILLLQAENMELKVLQDMAVNFQGVKKPSQNLKRNVQSSEQPSKRAKSEQATASFTSFLRGFFSYLPSNANTQERRRYCGLQAVLSRDRSSGLTQKDHVGLSHLLETSPHLKTDTLILRGLKVRVPAAV